MVNKIEGVKDIELMAKKLGISKDSLELYGKYKAKVNFENLKGVQEEEKNHKSKDSKNKSISIKSTGKLILVTATNPTPFGEGKTTISIGLADAFSILKKKVCLALREPSLGPVFGMKGGAAGGGEAQLYPAEDINLHFTGDMHAITSANNLICSIIDNHVYHGNILNIDINKINFKRCLDLNDRALRRINLENRKDSFNITAASDMMAIFCMAKDFKDLKNKISNTIVAESNFGVSIKVKDLKCVDAVLILLKDAIKPNLVQTLSGTPAFVHGGPFANIGLGCNSVISTKVALAHSDYTVTEAGFGADLGAEKFVDIKARLNKIDVACAVIVTTVRSLKFNGTCDMDNIKKENMENLNLGFKNLQQHIENLKNIFNLNVVVAINKFSSDTKNEIQCLENLLKEMDCEYSICEVFEKGGAGATDLAKKVILLASDKNLKKNTYTYSLKDPIELKIEKLTEKIYHAGSVELSELAKDNILKLTRGGFANLPICVAKTQYSFSDNPKLLGAPKDFKIKVKDVYLNSGAGFIVVICGDILLMPGLAKNSRYAKMRIDSKNKISL